MTRRFALGWHLAVLVACAVIPVLAFSVFLVARVATHDRAREERALVDATRTLAAALDREILLNVGMLELLAKSPHLASGDLAAFHAEAGRVALSRPAWQSVLLFAPDGQQLVNTTFPWGTPLVRVNDPASLAAVVQSGRPVVGALVRGQVTGQLAFPVRVPIVRDGAVVYVLTAAVRPESLLVLLKDALPDRGEWTRAFADGRGTIAARSREPERFVGQPSTPEFTRHIGAAPEDFYRGTTVEGAAVYVAFSRAPFSGWTASMALPVALIDGPVRRSVALMVGSGLALLGVTCAAAYVAGRRIARPIRAATDAAQALARGESLPVPASPVREVAELGASLGRSAELLRAHEAEREGLLAEARDARADAEAANRAKDEFLATLSHELRTPLNAMMGWVRMLRSGRLPPERAEHAIEVIDRNTSLQAQLINDLLDVSRIVAGKLRLERRPTDVRIAVREAVEQLRHVAEDKGVGVEIALPPSPVTVDGDSARLVQVIGNLLANAIKFTPAGGRVVIDVEERRTDVVVAVTDTGRGIPADVLPHVFERFRQAEGGISFRGLGLGLAIVRNLVELHGGNVDVASEGEGRGARFVVTLPRGAGRTAASDGAVPPPRAAPRPGLRVLLVEDEDDNREVLETMLRNAGLVVTPAASGDQALALWDRQPFDAVVSDLRMPGRDGYALIAEIRRRERGGARVRAIAVSANAAQQDRERSLASGFDRHLSKPVDPDELVASLA